tara:strand:+ start:1479 stop:2288 length:810 start_codon:yes stop_codon:yes gene_type:complete
VNNKLLFIILFLSSFGIYSQNFCTPKEIPFISGEEIIYDVSYHMANTWVPAGKVRFMVKDSTFKNINCFYIEGKGKTYKNYDWFFKVRDKYASFVSKESLKPTHFVRRVREGNFSLNYDYSFDYKNKKAVVIEKKNDVDSKETINISSCAYDLMTSVYFARAIDFNKYKIGDTIAIDIVLDKKVYEGVNIIYNGKEIIKTQHNKKINCINFKIDLIEGTIFKGDEKMSVFVTDDENKVPIYIEAEILVGSIKVFVNSIKNTKTKLKFLN